MKPIKTHLNLLKPTGSLYDISQLQIEDEEVLAEAGGKSNWSALSSALQTNVSYEFVSE